MVKKYVCIPHSFLVINVCNQGKTLCSPCIFPLPFILCFFFSFTNKTTTFRATCFPICVLIAPDWPSLPCITWHTACTDYFSILKMEPAGSHETLTPNRQSQSAWMWQWGPLRIPSVSEKCIAFIFKGSWSGLPSLHWPWTLEDEGKTLFINAGNQSTNSAALHTRWLKSFNTPPSEFTVTCLVAFSNFAEQQKKLARDQWNGLFHLSIIVIH